MAKGQGRRKRPRAIMLAIAARLLEAIESHLRLSDAEASRALGYSSTSMLSNVRSGTTLPDPERLIRLAALRTATGKQIDLHWLLTGEGLALRSPSGKDTLAALRKQATQAISTADHTTLQLAITAIARR